MDKQGALNLVFGRNRKILRKLVDHTVKQNRRLRLKTLATRKALAKTRKLSGEAWTIDDIRKIVPPYIRVQFDGEERYRIFPPDMLDDGDHFPMVLKKRDDKWVLSDDGGIVSRIYIEDFEAEIQILDGVEFDGSEFFLPATEGAYEKFMTTMLDVCNAYSRRLVK